MPNFDPLSSDGARPPLAAAQPDGAAGGMDTTASNLAVTLERTGAAAVWRGPAADSAEALADLVTVAAELAARGKRATLTIEPVGERFVAHVTAA